MLQAVAAGGGDRAKTTKAIFGIHITNGIIGNFTINATGDTNLTPITIYKQVGQEPRCRSRRSFPTASLIGG